MSSERGANDTRGLTRTPDTTRLVARRLEPVMTTRLTPTDIPDEIYAPVCAQATNNRRSLHSEASACLEIVLRAATPNTQDRLAQLQALRASLGTTKFAPADIDKFKREGCA